MIPKENEFVDDFTLTLSLALTCFVFDVDNVTVLLEISVTVV